MYIRILCGTVDLRAIQGNLNYISLIRIKNMSVNILYEIFHEMGAEQKAQAGLKKERS